MWIFTLLGIISAISPIGQNVVECESCRLVIESLKLYAMESKHWVTATELGIQICLMGGTYTEGVCAGAVRENAPIAIDSLLQRLLDPEYLCKELEYCSGPTYQPENFTQWVSNVMAGKPSKPRPTPTGKSSYNFAHLSDIHVDLFYVEGTQVDCNMPVCCRNGTGDAGRWGGYNCDLPIRTFESSLQQLQQMNPEFIIVTGDMPPHDIWNQSDSYNMGYQTIVSNLFKKYFPTTPVYGIFGNHACFPVNQYDFTPSAEDWLTFGFANDWGHWLSEDAKTSLITLGVYSMLHPNTNLRLVALNTQACNDQNFYLWVNSTDPGGQVQWLYKTLLAAEKNGELVYLYGHYYLADDGCLKYWSYHINALIDRFENTIAGMFFGHSHSDSFHVNRGVYSHQPTGIQFVGPSITTYTYKNPSFRVYTADFDTKQVTDINQYRLNLPAANNNPDASPVFELAYTFKQLYGVPDMSPQTIYDLGLNIANNETLALIYLNNHETGVNPPTSCDASCQHGLLCDLTYGVGDQVDICSGYQPNLNDEINDWLFPPWVYKVGK